MSYHHRSSVTYSTVKFRLTRMGKAVLWMTVVLLAILWLFDTGVTYGFLFVLVLVGGFDALESWRVMLNRELSLSCEVAQAALPELITINVSAAPGPTGLKVTPMKFTVADVLEMESFYIEPTEVVPRRVRMAEGWIPLAKSFAKFELSVSAFGLVEVRRIAVFTPPMTMGRVPRLGALTKDIIPLSLDEVGRLREYVPGDRRSRVSWTTTARTGTLHVRDPQIEEYGDVDVVLDLKPLGVGGVTPQETVNVIGWAGAVVTNLLDQGVTVRFHTIELAPAFYRDERDQQLADPWLAAPQMTQLHPYVPVIGDVSTRDELVRRLSLAEAGRVPRPHGPHLEVGPTGLKRVS